MSLLNTPIEISLRLLVLLDEWYPEPLSLAHLEILDYALVHSGDLGGPSSLHLDVPGKVTELAAQRQAVQDGLGILIRTDLAQVGPNAKGVVYSAGPLSSGFLSLFDSRYLDELRVRGEWLNASFRDIGDQALRTLMKTTLNSWPEAGRHE